MCICTSSSKCIFCVKWRTYVILCEVSDKKPHVFQNLKTNQPVLSVVVTICNYHVHTQYNSILH